MLRSLVLSVVPLVVILSSAVAFCDPVPVTTDLWDVAQGTVVTATSGTQNFGVPPHFPFSDFSHPENMFGGSNGSPEPTNTIFRDDEPTGFVHFVEWHTPAPVEVRSFNLFLNDDGTSPQRGVASFALYAKTGGNPTFSQVYSYTPPPARPYSHLTLQGSLPDVIASDWRAEFVQYNFGSFPGPRVDELDGFSTSIPEPGTFLAAALIPLGLMVRRPSRGAVAQPEWASGTKN